MAESASSTTTTTPDCTVRIQDVQPFTPIFIIVHDRVGCLKKCVNSYLRWIDAPIRLIFHDVASKYEPCLAYLQEMKAQGHELYRTNVNSHVTVRNTITTYLAEHPEIQYYIVTDPDVQLHSVWGDILDFYLYLARLQPNRCVGPMLHIDDIPDHYPRKYRVVSSDMNRFWGKPGSPIEFRGRTHTVVFADIDTTFQFAHRDLPMHFPRRGIRCLPPYSARHLDWYLKPSSLTPDQQYYEKHCSRGIAHWGHSLEPNKMNEQQKKQVKAWMEHIKGRCKVPPAPPPEVLYAAVTPPADPTAE